MYLTACTWCCRTSCYRPSPPLPLCIQHPSLSLFCFLGTVPGQLSCHLSLPNTNATASCLAFESRRGSGRFRWGLRLSGWGLRLSSSRAQTPHPGALCLHKYSSILHHCSSAPGGPTHCTSPSLLHFPTAAASLLLLLQQALSAIQCRKVGWQWWWPASPVDATLPNAQQYRVWHRVYEVRWAPHCTAASHTTPRHHPTGHYTALHCACSPAPHHKMHVQAVPFHNHPLSGRPVPG